MSILADTIRRRAEFAEANGADWRPKASRIAGNVATAVAILAGFIYRSDIISVLLRLLS